jgi:uncharacterized membrane protein
MIDALNLARWLHVIGATVLLGTGSGIAFFMVMAHRTGDAKIIAPVAKIVVIADFLFTASAVIVQPLTGLWLATLIGWPLTTPWLAVSLMLYLLIGLFWLPVVWMQIRMRDLARIAAEAGQSLPDAYHKLYRRWFACGFPAFAAVLAIIWLMLAKPDFPLQIS